MCEDAVPSFFQMDVKEAFYIYLAIYWTSP